MMSFGAWLGYVTKQSTYVQLPKPCFAPVSNILLEATKPGIRQY